MGGGPRDAESVTEEDAFTNVGCDDSAKTHQPRPGSVRLRGPDVPYDDDA
jgi:hypothetical protein